jgi:ABC-type nitrate/sulfonate/bicarbonate transport system substrate-binding protein
MPSTLRWGNPPSGIHNAPMYLGCKTGTFTLPGVQIETRDNLTGADYTQELLAGGYDMGHIGTPPLFAALTRSQEYTIIGQGLVKYPPFYVMAPATTGSLRELAGQVVSLNKLRTCPHSIIRTLLRWEGMAEDQIQLVSLVEGEAIVESIRRGDSAAAVLWEPYVSYVERVFGWKILAEGRTVMLPSNYGILVYARRSLLAAQPELVRNVLAAYAPGAAAGHSYWRQT